MERGTPLEESNAMQQEPLRRSSFDIGVDEKENGTFGGMLTSNRELSPIRGAPGSTGAASEKDPEESKVGGIEWEKPSEFMSPHNLVIEQPKKKKTYR